MLGTAAGQLSVRVVRAALVAAFGRANNGFCLVVGGGVAVLTAATHVWLAGAETRGAKGVTLSKVRGVGLYERLYEHQFTPFPNATAWRHATKNNKTFGQSPSFPLVQSLSVATLGDSIVPPPFHHSLCAQ